MTVGELIEKLLELPTDLPVITDSMSDYVDVDKVEVKEMTNQRGYWSFPYPHPNRGPQVMQKVVLVM
jgi:hypothetical protein